MFDKNHSALRHSSFRILLRTVSITNGEAVLVARVRICNMNKFLKRNLRLVKRDPHSVDYYFNNCLRPSRFKPLHSWTRKIHCLVILNQFILEMRYHKK